MAAPLTSSSSAPPKQQTLSYAERAKRGSAAPPVPASRARPVGTNGNARVGTQSTSPASSSRNIPPSSSNASTQPSTPPQPQQSEIQPVAPADGDASVSSVPKNTPKPPPTNVWTARKEQMAQRAAATQPPAPQNPRPQPTSQPPSRSENSDITPVTPQLAEKTGAASNRTPLNGIMNTTSHDNSFVPPTHVSAKNKIEDDPFVVRMPPHLQASTSASASVSSGKTPPSLDDVESWPEMVKPGSSVSASGSVSGAASTTAEGDKKESVTATPRKSE